MYFLASAEVHNLEETHILLFLIQVAVLLLLARGLGEVFRRWGQPSITAEILVGVLLGPTLLGRMTPGLHAWLFPADATQNNMLDTVAWLGILFFLLKTGHETNFAMAWRQRGNAVLIALSDLIIPMIIAFIPSVLIASHYTGAKAGPVVFALFVATIMTISALPVTARLLQELRVYRTDLGLLVMSALTINDVAGWIVFALILGFVTEAALSLGGVVFIIVATLLFAVLCISVGRRATDSALAFFQRAALPEPAASLTLVCLAGMVCGAITTWIGIHALFGFFIAGIMTGESRKLSENTRYVFAQMVQAILVPLFFASIGLRVDFFAHFDPFLVVFILVVGISGRYVGAWIGAAVAAQPKASRSFISVAHVPGGEMQIVISLLALEYDVISKSVFVAIVFGAILSSVIAGPWMKYTLTRFRRLDWLAYLSSDRIVLSLTAGSRSEAIRELALQAERAEGAPDADTIAKGVLDREAEMGTSLDEGIALPHARMDNLPTPVIVVGRSQDGIDWNSRDGKPARILFFVLTPSDQAEAQTQILRGIAQAVIRPDVRDALIHAATPSNLIQVLREAQSQVSKPA
jgi:Kef-type K+ transport system membrane component KefB/mannitol/fructose-specific phosphotransferase system IIA component (Ntr-type)